MILEQGNLLEQDIDFDYILFTGNGYVTKDGRLVMGRGFAKTILHEQEGIDRELAQNISSGEQGVWFYNLTFAESGIGAFQVKDHWSNKAHVGIIRKSAEELCDFAGSVFPRRIDMNFPGIGNGGLEKDEVLPYIKCLPDNVHVWEL